MDSTRCKARPGAARPSPEHRHSVRRPLLTACCLLIGLALSPSLQAEAVIEKLEGQVETSVEGARPDSAREKQVLAGGTTVTTGPNGRAVLSTSQGVFVLHRNASMTVRNPGFFSHLLGRIYYAFRKLQSDRPEPRGVETVTATLGLRGTQFMVDADATDQVQVAMREGLINVESNADGFMLYQDRINAEFEAYRREFENAVRDLREEFRAYQENQQREFIGFVSELELGAGQSISISGGEAATSQVSAEANRAMDELRDFAADIFNRPEFQEF